MMITDYEIKLLTRLVGVYPYNFGHQVLHANFRLESERAMRFWDNFASRPENLATSQLQVEVKKNPMQINKNLIPLPRVIL